MVLSRAAASAQASLFTALCDGDAAAVVAMLAPGGRVPSTALVLDQVGGVTALHWAAAVAFRDPQALAALLAAGLQLDAPLPATTLPPSLAAAVYAPWLSRLIDAHLDTPRRGALQPGMTPLAIACRLGYVDVVAQLLQLGADPNAAGTDLPVNLPKPFTPLSAVVLSSDGAGGAVGAAAVRVAELLLRAGADPLAHSSRRRCSTLRCACGSEFLPNQTLPLMLNHLERQLAQGRLAFGSGDTAAEVMVGAARCRRLRLFNVAHEFVLAASGRRPQPLEPPAGAAGGLGRAPRRTIDSPSSSTSSGGSQGHGSEEAGIGGGGSGSGAEGEDESFAAWLARVVSARPVPRWQPTSQQLFEVLRSAALGGSIDILRTILRSPLPFNVRETDAVGKGLMAHSAAHAGCPAAVALLHSAGAQLDLPRLLYVIEKTVAAAPVTALLACQRPQVPTNTPTIRAGGFVSLSCPIHRLIHIHRRGTQPGADKPSTWEREVMMLLECLLAAGYRPTIYHSVAKRILMMGVGDGPFVTVGNPFDPFELFPPRHASDRRMLLVARGAEWSIASHPDWPDAFKAAARALLLAAHRLSRSCSGTQHESGRRPGAAATARRRQRGKAPRLAEDAATLAGPAGASLANLPQDLVLKIVGLAALPMSAWM